MAFNHNLPIQHAKQQCPATFAHGSQRSLEAGIEPDNMKLIQTSHTNADFKALCGQLDAELNSRYGKSQSRYDQHNVIVDNQNVIVGYIDGIPVACGCFKALDQGTIEIKRMFITAAHRRQGLSTALLASLEKWAGQLGFSTALLETGKGQPEAIGLYLKQGYRRIENYGPYAGMAHSLCMKKNIKSL